MIDTINRAERYLPPEYSTGHPAGYAALPAAGETGAFKDFMEIARGVVSGVFQQIPAVIGEVPTGATGSFAELISAQLQAQVEMQTTSLVSNIERSKHESKMAAIRNIRVG